MGLYYLTGQPLLLALVYTGSFLNLFNLVPAHPLDGGRIATAVSLWLWALGIPVLAYMAATSSNPLLWIILLLRHSRRTKHGNTATTDTTNTRRAALALRHCLRFADYGVGGGNTCEQGRLMYSATGPSSRPGK